MLYNKNIIEASVRNKGYVWFNSPKNFDVNIVGVRNENTNDQVTDLFDDVLTLSYRLNGTWMYHEWKITTDPGRRAVLNFENPAGVARLVEGQYRGAYKIGLHRGRYRALVQVKPVKVYRDSNKDLIHNETRIQEGLFGINIHRASIKGTTPFVSNWSFGCQVFTNPNDYNQFMNIMENSSKIFGNSFSYTLLKSSDILR